MLQLVHKQSSDKYSKADIINHGDTENTEKTNNEKIPCIFPLRELRG
jgi:hypothetical protein